MGVNKHQPHLFVIPEDDANRQIANGFHLGLEFTRSRQLQVLAVAGGWTRVLETFEIEEVAGMRKWPTRFMVLLIDFSISTDTPRDSTKQEGEFQRIW